MNSNQTTWNNILVLRNKNLDKKEQNCSYIGKIMNSNQNNWNNLSYRGTKIWIRRKKTLVTGTNYKFESDYLEQYFSSQGTKIKHGTKS
jgi:hypothetical protein